METGLFNDILAAAGPDADILAKYSSNYYEGRPALAETLCGKGKVLHFGGTFTRDNVKAFLAYTGVLQPYQYLAEVSEACEIAMRVKDGKRYLFILNYDKEPQKVVLKEAVMDMDTKDEVQGSVLLKDMRPRFTGFFKIQNIERVTEIQRKRRKAAGTDTAASAFFSGGTVKWNI